jgi:hypothetical protein
MGNKSAKPVRVKKVVYSEEEKDKKRKQRVNRFENKQGAKNLSGKLKRRNPGEESSPKNHFDGLKQKGTPLHDHPNQDQPSTNQPQNRNEKRVEKLESNYSGGSGTNNTFKRRIK